MCTIIVRDMMYICWFMKKTYNNVSILYVSSTSRGVRSCCDCHMLTQYPCGSKFHPPENVIEMHPNTCWVTISWIWSTPARNMFRTASAPNNYSTRTGPRLTINNITQYRWMDSYHLTEFYHLQDEIDSSHQGSTSVGAPKLPSMS
jgi:hypothetical protein